MDLLDRFLKKKFYSHADKLKANQQSDFSDQSDSEFEISNHRVPTLMSFSLCSQIKRKEISFWGIKIFQFWHFGRNKCYLFQILGPLGAIFCHLKAILWSSSTSNSKIRSKNGEIFIFSYSVAQKATEAITNFLVSSSS